MKKLEFLMNAKIKTACEDVSTSSIILLKPLPKLLNLEKFPILQLKEKESLLEKYLQKQLRLCILLGLL